MNLLMQTAAIIKILYLFSAIVILYKIKIPLWTALIVASLIAGLWFGASFEKTLRYAAGSAVSAETLFLCAAVFLIMAFSTMLEGTGVLKRIVDAFSALFGNSMYSAGALPALIGLLPMPGGAIFSAPMVDAACDKESGPDPEQKSVINYWFRHLWEYWWPLYPGIILASSLFGITSWKLFLLHLPLTIAAVVSGWFFILRPAFRKEREAACAVETQKTGSLKSALSESASIIVVILVIFGVGPILSAARIDGIPAKYWPVVFGMAAGIIWLSAAAKLDLRRMAEFIFTRHQVSMLLMAAGVMMFRDMLMAVDAFTQAKLDLATYHVPAIVVIAALPFISGFVLGLAVGFVGASFPLVISLLPAAVMHSEARLAYLTFAYAFAYAGMMISPVHLCLIVTKDYFKADFLGIYRWLLAPTAMIVVTGVLLFFLYLRIL